MNVIIQCGGRGSRLRHHTWNKPKCLLSVEGKPILYHLFDTFKHHQFFVICDYKSDVLETYLNNFPPGVMYTLIKTDKEGTCSGINQALESCVGPVWVVWGDLILKNEPTVKGNHVFTTGSFSCRWSLQNNRLEEKTSDVTGIPGLFYFRDREVLNGLPDEGEFVKWLSQSSIQFTTPSIYLSEYGDCSTIEKLNDRSGYTRFFNDIKIDSYTVTKRAKLEEYKHLIDKEVQWYKAVELLNYKHIPRLVNESPLVLENIHGLHPYKAASLHTEKTAVLINILDALEELHNKVSYVANDIESRDVYINKTIKRVESVKKIIPNFNKPSITVNGKKVRNIFHPKYEHLLEEIYYQVKPYRFTPIHGDPHFSNIIINRHLKPKFIDPRGYFSSPGIFGDKNYDNAKVYYSAVGGFDHINRKKFKLVYDSQTVEVILPEQAYPTADLEFRNYFKKDYKKIKFIHGLIWLAFSGYAIDDVDSIIASFYNGLYWLEDAYDTV